MGIMSTFISKWKLYTTFCFVVVVVAVAACLFVVVFVCFLKYISRDNQQEWPVNELVTVRDFMISSK